VACAGLNFVDALARRGLPGYASGWPFVPGLEVSGRVCALGPDVAGLEPGQRVVAFTVDGGGLAETVVAAAALTVRIPDDLTDDVATTVPATWATALGLLHAAAVRPGDAVLVTSAGGGVGVALGRLLDRHGIGPLIGGVGRPGKAAGLAAPYLGLARSETFLDDAQALAGRPFDVVLESLGGSLLAASLGAMASGGRLVSYGGAAGEPDPDLPDWRALRAGNATLAGFSIINLTRRRPLAVRDLIREAIALAGDGLELTVPRTVPWSEALAAHLAQSEGQTSGKVVVDVGAG
jgi:NADPH2:quinone reductase